MSYFWTKFPAIYFRPSGQWVYTAEFLHNYCLAIGSLSPTLKMEPTLSLLKLIGEPPYARCFLLVHSWVKYPDLAGGVPMPQHLPYMDMGESPCAACRVPGTKPCTVSLI